MASGGKDTQYESSSNKDALSEELREATVHKIKLFESIRGKHCSIPFWDVIVITAIDDAQKLAYERQISDKIERKELPLGVKFIIISDPIGAKIGNGGSTLVVAEELEKLFKDQAKELKVLVIHAGGFSQRLPSGSLLGKIFMALPMGNPIYQTLELKLAMYIEFPQRMPPGMFVTSADTIELYVLDGDWTFKNSGFTALAHPSPIEIGTTHGVFVLDDSSVKSLLQFEKNDQSVQNGTCKKFIHKPTREYMHSSGAVFQHNGEDYVYSDSAFFMDYESVELLLNWKKKHGPISCEIDAYGDFLQALGPEGTVDYCKNVRNVTLVEPTLVKTREDIFNLLRSSKLNVLMLNKSKFYHMGTTTEYIHHFCEDMAYRYEMACSNIAMIKEIGEGSYDKSSCILHSFLGGENQFGHNSVTEYSWLGRGSYVGEQCIVSNVFASNGLSLPSDVFLHTVCVKSEDGASSKYITISFGIKDNVKKTCNSCSSADDLKWHSKPLKEALKLLEYPQNPWPQDCLLLNIWNACLFPAMDDARSSLKYACDVIDSLKSNKSLGDKRVGAKLYSMVDILREKDIDGIFKMREEIRNAILH